MAGKGVSAVVLAAGYGTRLERDLLQDTSGLVLHSQQFSSIYLTL
jgi:CTP:molybdopterin cytidylyltransferase MocA